MNVGFAGIGIMGSGMSANLVKAGFTVYVYNRTRSKAEAISGATVVSSLKELCSSADIVFTCVSNDASLREVLFSPEGIVTHLTPSHILVDSSTVSVDVTSEVADACNRKGAAFLDAPVTGGQKGAQEGTLMFMIGGDQLVFEKIRNVFEAMGTKLVYCGPSTFGQRTKIALNLTQAMVLESYLEGLTLAMKEGVLLATMRDVLDNSGAKNKVAESKMPSIEAGDFRPTFFLKLMHKDLQLAKQEITKLGLELPIAQATIGVLQEGMNAGFGEKDWVAIAKLLENKAGIHFRH